MVAPWRVGVWWHMACAFANNCAILALRTALRVLRPKTPDVSARSSPSAKSLHRKLEPNRTNFSLFVSEFH